ncbi:YitT family protein [Paenibacillus sp. ISL-20]|nr:YitT family protein [Paenibacillus sp. ISL-20]
MTRQLMKRYIILIVGLFLMGLGTALVTKANIGTSPIASVPYVLSLKFPLSMGLMTILLCLLFVVIQVLLLGKQFPKMQYLQVFVGVLFGLFLDMGAYIVSSLNFTVYFMKILALLTGCMILAIGIYLQIIANTILNPGEGIVKVISEKLGAEFGNIKIMFDWTLVSIGIVISLFAFGSVEGVREGTVISAFLVGYFIKLLRRIMFRLRSKRAREAVLEQSS